MTCHHKNHDGTTPNLPYLGSHYYMYEILFYRIITWITCYLGHGIVKQPALIQKPSSTHYHKSVTLYSTCDKLTPTTTDL